MTTTDSYLFLSYSSLPGIKLQWWLDNRPQTYNITWIAFLDLVLFGPPEHMVAHAWQWSIIKWKWYISDQAPVSPEGKIKLHWEVVSRLWVLLLLDYIVYPSITLPASYVISLHHKFPPPPSTLYKQEADWIKYVLFCFDKTPDLVCFFWVFTTHHLTQPWTRFFPLTWTCPI